MRACAAGRRHTLTGKSRFAAAAAAYEHERRDGRLPATWEVIYAHAWAPQPGAPIREGGFDVTSIPVSNIPIRRRWAARALVGAAEVAPAGSAAQHPALPGLSRFCLASQRPPSRTEIGREHV